MHPSHASLCSKLLSIFFAATLTVGLVPSAAFAASDDLQSIPEGSEGAAPIASSAEGGSDDVFSHCPSDDAPSADGGSAAISSEDVPDNDNDHAISTEADDGAAILPAGDIINQEMELDTVVAQAESTRSFFLAQTLESTRTVPVVSAKLPIDTGANDAADASAEDGASSSEEEGSDDSDGDSESDDPVDPSFTLGSSEGDSAAVAAESTVIGSFEYRGITYAVEPGGESVALMVVDYNKLPEEFIQKQVLVIPDMATPDGIDHYSVTRIADDAFASLTKDNANPDYVGCEALFSDEELLAEAGIDPSEVAEFLSDDGAAAAAQEGESANADSDIQAQAEACAYGDQAASNPAIISSVVDLNDGDASNLHVISSGVSGANGAEKSRPSDEGEGEALTVSSDDESIGITTITIPASITTIEGDAFTGFDTLQCVIVSDDNQSYASYDGALYSADLTNLLLIPEGRLGAVRIAPSVTTIDPQTFSHCAVDTVVVDVDSAAYQLLKVNELYNVNSDKIEVLRDITFDEENTEFCQLGYQQITEKLDEEREASSDFEIGERTTHDAVTTHTVGDLVYKIAPASDRAFSKANSAYTLYLRSEVIPNNKYYVNTGSSTSGDSGASAWNERARATLIPDSAIQGVSPTLIGNNAVGGQLKLLWNYAAGLSLSGFNANRWTTYFETSSPNQSVTAASMMALTEATLCDSSWNPILELTALPSTTQVCMSGNVRIWLGPMESDITFDLNGADPGQMTPDTIVGQRVGESLRNLTVDGKEVTGIEGESTSAVFIPQKVGYEFDGFWTEKTGGTQFYDECGHPTKDEDGNAVEWNVNNLDTTLYAHWIANLDWENLGPNTIVSSLPTSTLDSNIAAPDPGHRSGFAFDGWKVAYADGTANLSDGTKGVPAEDNPVALYQQGDAIPIRGHATIGAQWTALDYSVELDLGAPSYEGELFLRVAGSGEGIGAVDGPNLVADEGEGTDGHVVATTSYRASADGGRVVLPMFARAGYELMGWRVRDGGQPSGTDASGALADMVGTEEDPFTGYAFATGDGADPSIVRGNVRL